MAWIDYIAVTNSDLYDHQGISKCILARICMLIERTEEGEKQTPNEGFCTATQAYIAAQIGCSESTVLQAVKQFVGDGWIVSVQYETRHGGRRNKYKLADGAMKKIMDRKMKKDEDGEFVRTKQTSKSRAPNGRRFTKKQDGKLPGCKTAICADASGQIAGLQNGKLPAEGLEVSLGAGFTAGREPNQANELASLEQRFNSQTSGTSSQNPDRTASEPPRGLLGSRDPAVGLPASQKKAPPAPPQVQDETTGDHVWSPGAEGESCVYCGRDRTRTERPGQCKKLPVRIARRQREVLAKSMPLSVPAPGSVGATQFAAMTGASPVPRESVL